MKGLILRMIIFSGNTYRTRLNSKGWTTLATILHLLYALNYMSILEEVFAFKSGHEVLC